MEVQKLYLGIREEAQEQTEYEDMMLGYTDNVLKQKVFTELEQRRFVQMMAEAAESFYTKNPSGMPEQHYESVCMRLLGLYLQVEIIFYRQKQRGFLSDTRRLEEIGCCDRQ